MAPLFESAGHKMPDNIRVTCGWPSSGGLGTSKRTVGQCWSTTCSEDGSSQIFISPFLADSATCDGVLACLVHEVIHAVVGVDKKHGKPFKDCMKKIGLEGKVTATIAGDRLLGDFGCWMKTLGDYPHARLDKDHEDSPDKKQSTRMIKCECEQCGYTARTTRKWLDEVGSPWCPRHKEAMFFKLPDEDEDGGEDE
jgi:hypothetical protein